MLVMSPSFWPGLMAGHCLGSTIMFPAASTARPTARGEIGQDCIRRRTFAYPPAFIDDDILVTGFLHAVRGQSFGLLLHDLGIDYIGETVPGVPSHRRGTETRGCRHGK